MKKLILVILLSIPFIVLAQEKDVPTGSTKYLDYKHGFKNIILGSEIASLEGKVKLGSKEKDGTSYFFYTDKTDTTIAGVSISNIILRTYQDKILNIVVYLDADYAHKLFSVFTEAYGNRYERPNQFMNKFNWLGKKAELDFDFESKNPTAQFTDVILNKDYNKMMQNLNKKAIGEL